MSLLRGGGGGVVNLMHEDDNAGGVTGFGRSARILVDNPFRFLTEVYANKFVQVGDTLQIRTPRAIASSTATGIMGEICWAVSGGAPYLYVCIATNTWRRIELVGF
jgi:hypothetical protein